LNEIVDVPIVAAEQPTHGAFDARSKPIVELEGRAFVAVPDAREELAVVARARRLAVREALGLRRRNETKRGGATSGHLRHFQ
jgi:hypothetical protein